MTSVRAIPMLSLLLAGCWDPGGISATDEDPGNTASTNESGSSSTTTSSSTGSSESTTEADDSSSTTGEPGSESSESGEPLSCGNGVVDDGEACDDGNEIDGDGCNVDCIESGTLLDEWIHVDDPQQPAFARDVDVGPDGEFVIVGAVTRNDIGQGPNALVRKYAEDGTIEWTRTYNNALANGMDLFASAEIDDDGTIVVGGFESRPDVGQGMNLLLRRYDADGNDEWMITHNTPVPNSEEVIYGLGIDDAGQIYTGGYAVRNDLEQGINFLMGGWDAFGENQWIASYDSVVHGTDLCSGFAVDGEGNNYCAGYEDRPDLGQGMNQLLVKTAPDGEVLWTRSFDSEAHDGDALSAVDVAANGTIVVGGFETRRDLEEGRNVSIRNLDDEGNEMWAVTFDGAESLDDVTYSVSVDPLGNVIAGGYEVTAEGEFATWIRKLDPEGEMLWSETVDLGEGHDSVIATDVWPDGRIIATGFVEPLADDPMSHIWVRIYAP